MATILDSSKIELLLFLSSLGLLIFIALILYIDLQISALYNKHLLKMYNKMLDRISETWLQYYDSQNCKTKIVELKKSISRLEEDTIQMQTISEQLDRIYQIIKNKNNEQ